jgi:hemolysin activation/secretion protein
MAVCAALSMVSVRAQSVVTPNPADEQRRQQERDAELQRRQQPQVNVRLPSVAGGVSATDDLLPKNESPCFTIQNIDLVGADADHFTWVLERLSGQDGGDAPQGQCLGARGIGAVIKRAQDALIAEGYVTSRVLAQPQDLSKGRLALSVVAGRIRNVRYVGNSVSATSADTPNRNPVLGLLPLRVGAILNLRDVEQALEMLKRAPTADADIKIEPGAAPGESDLFITYRQSTPFRANFSGDDSGGQSTGKYQGALTLSIDNPLLANDLFYVTLNGDLAMASARGTRGRSAHYSIAFGYWTLSLNGSENRYFQTVIGATQDYVYSGNSANADVKLSRLVHRDSVSKTSLSLRAFSRKSRNFVDDTEVQVQRRSVGGWELGFNQRRYVGPSIIEGSLQYKRGTGAFNSLAAPEELFGEGTSRFKLLTADVSYSQPFKLGEQAFSYSSAWRAQWNRSTLTPQDRFSIGSRYSVRGFNGENSLSAERGWSLRNDISFAAAPGHQLYWSLDYGRVSGPSSDLLAGKSLTGTAFGLRGGFNGLQYDLFVGIPISHPQQFRAPDANAGFNLNYSF